MKKLFNVMAILSFLSMVAFAEDFLAKVTNGALSDYDEGVRLLSAEEEGKVVGGIYIYRPFDRRISNYGFPVRYTVYGEIDLFGDKVNRNNPIEVLKFKRDTYQNGRHLGLRQEYRPQARSDAIGVTWGQVKQIYVQSNYHYSRSVPFNHKYTYSVFYTLVGSNKLYEAYTKKARDLANFYQFRAKHALDSKRY
ncbi:hypothetical protein [Helicobacter apodemus]|uniref:Uncharacterized protein n=1 Tax=Helicobacter apodemus TaxID=135569 RepID=A0A2U8FEM3_9HELI|nr:hypothetical protein [Helicobacter apodemus]AWI34398.1 hypothetical protein CDV25_06215 [Helicobacter apodemus]AWI34468.1 hypothetical protein CDV25_06605 [Helicobacter apodemus]